MIEEKHIIFLKGLLKNGKTIDNLSDFVNHTSRLQNAKHNKTHIIISTKQLAYYLSQRDKKYVKFTIPKKTAGVREILAPDKYLKTIQRRLTYTLNLFYEATLYANGFIKGRSILTNAQKHINKEYVFNIDLKNFFPTIHYGRIKSVLQLPPFEASPEMAHYIAHLSCYKGILPQGSPISPFITNIICQKLDYKFAKLAMSLDCSYSRYADDITFSANKNVFTGYYFQTNMFKIIKAEGFNINEKKTRLQSKYYRQEVTGIIVNKKPNLSRIYIKKIRAMLYNWETKGIQHCKNNFSKYYIKEKGYARNKTIPSFKNVLHGKILFLGMVRGKDDKYFVNFMNKYKNLCSKQ